MSNNAIELDIHGNIGLCMPETATIEYGKMTVNMIFGIKFDAGFTHKARLVADGSKVDTPPSMTYVSVVSIGSTIILLLIASLNFLE